MSTAQNNVLRGLGSDSCAVEGCVGDVGLEDVKGLDIDELCGLVLGGGEEVCPVGGPLQVGDCLS